MSATISNRERATLESYGFSTARAIRKNRRERDLAAKRSNRERDAAKREAREARYS